MELLKHRPDLVNMIKSVAIEQRLGHYRISNVTTNSKGEGYGGQIYLITIKDFTKKEQLDVVIKAAFTEDSVRAVGSIEPAYENESHFYCTVYPTFKKFERAKGILESVEHIPKCYRVSFKKREEALCLENLKINGFELFDQKLTLDHEHISLIFKTYGRVHAYSFALKDQQPKEYAKLAKGFHCILLKLLNDGYEENMIEMMTRATKYLTPETDDQVMKKFEKYATKEIGDIFRYVLAKPEDFSVILHGDCWSNNMLFKYEESESRKKLRDMRLLDFQLSMEGSPVNDLSYCLYSAGAKELYDNLDDYLKIYHDSLSSFLKQLGSDPEKVFPFDALKNHWKRYSRFGMMMGIMVQKVKLTEIGEIRDFTDGFESNAEAGRAVIDAKFDETTFQQRLRELLHHVSEVDAL